MKKIDSLILQWVLGGSIFAVPGLVLAQGEPPPAPPPTAPAAVPGPDAPPPAAPEAAVAPTMDVAPAEPPPVEPVAEEPMPMEEPATVDAMLVAEEPAGEAAADEGFTVTTGVGFRAALRMQDPADPEKLGDIGFDEINVEPRFSGRVTDVVGWTANLTVSGRTIDSGELTGSPTPLAFEARALDLIGQLDFDDWFHVWVGRMLTPSDRSNFSGAWFMAPWNYTGAFFTGPAGYIGPRGTEEFGRETGVVAWGHDPEGKFKYYLGAMDLDSNAGNTNAAAVSPLYAARVGYAIIGSEPGFYSSSTYYGSQDILAIGAAFRAQSQLGEDDVATPMVDEADGTDLTEFNVDVLAEFNPEGIGTIGGEVAYYGFDSDINPVDQMFVGVLTYATPGMIGIGKLGPVLRFQMATGDDDLKQTQFDIGLAYLMKDYFAKLQVTYTAASATSLVDPTDPDEGTADTKANLVQLGFEIQQ